MSETIRPAREEDRDAIVDVVRHSFTSAIRPAEEWSREIWGQEDRGVEHMWVAEDGGEVVATCYLLPFRQWVRGVPLRSAGVGGVAVSVTHRRRGLAARMLREALVEARGRGVQASALFPFRAGFYQRLGYGLAGEADQVIVPPRAFPRLEEGPLVVAVRSPEGRASVADFHAEWIRGQNGQIERSPSSWRRLLDPAGVGAVRVMEKEGGDTTGYAVFRPHIAGERRDRRLEVVEWAWSDDEARAALFDWAGSLADQWSRIAVRTRPVDRILDRLREPRSDETGSPGWELWFAASTRMRGPMFSILNVPEVLGSIRLTGDAAFTIEVRDDTLTENSGAWGVRVHDGAAEIERGEAAGAPRLSLDVSTLARLVAGDLLPSEAAHVDLGRIDHPEALSALDAVFRTTSPWTFERF